MIMRKKIVPLLIGKEVSPPRVGVSVFPLALKRETCEIHLYTPIRDKIAISCM